MWWRALLEILFPPRRSERLVRRGQHALGALSTPWFIEGAGLQTIALLPYREPLVRAHIIEAKFHGNILAQKTLGTLLGEYLFEYLVDDTSYESKTYILVPLPLSVERKRARGYNQVEEICREALQHLSTLRITLLPDLLVRTRDTLPQTSLQAEARAKNMEGAFNASHPLSGEQVYILVDDVFTTGATLLSATEALRSAGAISIIPVTLAH